MNGVRSQIRRIRQPLTDEELDPEPAQIKESEEKELNNVIQKISLERLSLEESRKEAKKPLYLVRYE